MSKATRILRAFTVDGVSVLEDDSSSSSSSGSDKKKKKQVRALAVPLGRYTLRPPGCHCAQKVLRKIPAAAFEDAVGLVIYTSMRLGFAPFGGAGGSGLVIARLPDGSWSGPSLVSPNNYTAGFLAGLDIYDAVLIIRSEEALQSFRTHKATLGTDIGVAVGPTGAGAAVEIGKERAPLLSYVKTRGLYAGIQLVGQVFVERFDENARFYDVPTGVKAGEILSGKVHVPKADGEKQALVRELHSAIEDARRGYAQASKPTPTASPGTLTPTEVDEETARAIELAEKEGVTLPPPPEAMPDDYAAAPPAALAPPPPLPRRPQDAPPAPLEDTHAAPLEDAHAAPLVGGPLADAPQGVSPQDVPSEKALSTNAPLQDASPHADEKAALEEELAPDFPPQPPLYQASPPLPPR